MASRPYTRAGALAAMGGVLTWGFGVVFIKLTSSHFLVVSFYRHAFSIPLLVAAWAVASDRKLPWRAGAIGGALFAAHQLANFSALRYSTAAVVTILFSLQPILVGTLGGRFVGESATKRFYLWSTVAVAGCAIVVGSSTSDASTTPLGATLSIVNLIAWCGYYLASKRARENTTAISWMLVMTVVSGAVVGVIALIARQPLGVTSSRELGLLAAIGILPGTLGHVLVTWAHPRIHIAASSSLILGVPIIATIGAAIFADEPFGPWQVLGGAIALFATAMALRHLPPPVAAEAGLAIGEVAS